MSDRELLEMAAKAAGVALEWNDQGASGYWGVWRDLPQWELWNPLTDDGDALRLAVKLHRFAVSTLDDECYSGPDVYAATRRAIVRAAAAIAQDGGART